MSLAALLAALLANPPAARWGRWMAPQMAVHLANPMAPQRDMCWGANWATYLVARSDCKSAARSACFAAAESADQMVADWAGSLAPQLGQSSARQWEALLADKREPGWAADLAVRLG